MNQCGERWYFQPLALGDTLGAGFLSMVNTNADPLAKHHWLDIQGDPTLRLNPMRPPGQIGSALVNNQVSLSWAAGEPGNTRYHVYRAATFAGPFGQPIASPVAQNVTVADDPAKRVYLIRGEKLFRTGVGSYVNLSQGAFRAIP